jgi:hypothetical protein
MPNPILNIRSTYNFEVYGTQILGNNYSGVTILAIMDADSAAKEIDAVSKHAAMFPYLPNGTPNNWRSYDYVKIKTVTNQVTVIGMPWIKENTITLVEARTATIKVGNVTGSDANRIRNALITNGFNDIEITIN